MGKTAEPLYARVARVWPESTVVCIGSGPSLTVDDVAFCQGRARVIAVKDAIQVAPWADAIYGTGMDVSGWWPVYGPRLVDMPGLKYTMDRAAAKWAHVLKMTGELGLELDPSGLRHGHNSGYAAINLAVHLGARRIVLLGYDIGRAGPKYFFGNRVGMNQVESPYGRFLMAFATLVEPLKALGIQVVNASRTTALACFPRQSLSEALT